MALRRHEFGSVFGSSRRLLSAELSLQKFEPITGDGLDGLETLFKPPSLDLLWLGQIQVQTQGPEQGLIFFWS
jgi:hypothetical protein